MTWQSFSRYHSLANVDQHVPAWANACCPGQAFEKNEALVLTLWCSRAFKVLWNMIWLGRDMEGRTKSEDNVWKPGGLCIRVVLYWYGDVFSKVMCERNTLKLQLLLQQHYVPINRHPCAPQRVIGAIPSSESGCDPAGSWINFLTALWANNLKHTWHKQIKLVESRKT